jgi:hypothetical protein
MNAMNLHDLSEYYANSAQISHDTNDYLIAAWLEENAVDALAKRCESHTQSTKTTQSTKKKCLQNLTT